MPNLVVPMAVLTIGIPCDRMLLVVSDNPAGEITHHSVASGWLCWVSQRVYGSERHCAQAQARAATCATSSGFPGKPGSRARRCVPTCARPIKSEQSTAIYHFAEVGHLTK